MESGDNREEHYRVLGVPPSATSSEIKTAYRRLAKQYHPDVNPSTEAAKRMAEINHAYSILSDPARKAAYDAGLGFAEESEKEEFVESVEYAEAFIRDVRCQGCGRFDHTLRVVAFPYVISIIIMSFKRFEAGIFCHYCRSAKSAKCAAISLLFGWWGFPFGIFWTLESLVVNFLRGNTPKEENQQLLKQLAWVNAILGRIDEAKAALRDLLKYDKSEEARRIKDEFYKDYPTIKPSKVSGVRFGYLAIVTAIIAMYVFIGGAIFGESSETSDIIKSTPAQAVPVTPSKPVPITTPKTSPLIPPSDSFVVWQDTSNWVSHTTARISGSVTNAHHDWSITNVKIVMEMVDKSDIVIQKANIAVLPSTITPSGKGEYNKTVEVPYSCDAFSTVLYWTWEPP